MTQQTLDMLADMKLSAMAAELANQLKILRLQPSALKNGLI